MFVFTAADQAVRVAHIFSAPMI